MSHFPVAVFTDENTSVEELLEPFYENRDVEKYVAITKQDLIEQGKMLIRYQKKLYKKYMQDKRAYRRENVNDIEHLRMIKKVPAMLKWDDEKIYKYEIKSYKKEEISEDGGIYSTYNLNSKWSWYRIGRYMEGNAYSRKR